MKRLKKSNRVSWAPGVKLCQVRLFLSEDCPSKVGVKSQAHLQVKTSRISVSNYVDSDAHPSGFDGRHYVNPLKEKLSHIPQIKWQCPHEFVLNCNWCVAVGEESEEAQAQKHREIRVLEAVYPRHSAIPPSPSVSLDVEECNHDDSHTPLVPITPIEEDDATDMPPDVAAPLNASINSQSLALAQHMLISGNPSAHQCNPPASLNPSADEIPAFEMLPELQADVVAAAAAALTAILKSKEQGSMIDTDLLIKFLSYPKMIEKLINENKAPANTQTVPISGPKPLTPSAPLRSTKTDLVFKKLINEHGAPANTGNTPISGSKQVTPSAPLRSTKTDLVSKKLINEHGAPANTGTAPISGSKPVTPSAPLRSTKTDLVSKKLINEHGAPANTGTTHISGSKPVTTSVPLPGSEPDVVIKKLINEHGAAADTGTASISGSKPVTTSLVPLPSSKPDFVKIKRMIDEYGPPDNTGNKPTSGLATVIPLSLPKLRPNLHPVPNMVPAGLPMKPVSPDAVPVPSFSTMTAPPVKDINYYKSLIKQHGEMQETKDYNLSQFGKPRNHLQDPELVQNYRPIEMKPKNQKPCMYFNSPKGCRNGSNCPYQHDLSYKLRLGSMLEAPSAKKMKLGWEITGRT